MNNDQVNSGKNKSLSLHGQCMCGAVAFCIDGPVGVVVNCHCLKCRRWHGAVYRTRVAIGLEYFHWQRGEDYVAKCHSSGNVIKTFCKKCGSNLISYLENNPASIGVPIGSLEGDDAALLQPSMHIFVGSKAPWHVINDDLPQYEEWPPGGSDAVRNNYIDKVK